LGGLPLHFERKIKRIEHVKKAASVMARLFAVA
jgi:hypothetical protein